MEGSAVKTRKKVFKGRVAKELKNRFFPRTFYIPSKQAPPEEKQPRSSKTERGPVILEEFRDDQGRRTVVMATRNNRGFKEA